MEDAEPVGFGQKRRFRRQMDDAPESTDTPRLSKKHAQLQELLETGKPRDTCKLKLLHPALCEACLVRSLAALYITHC